MEKSCRVQITGYTSVYYVVKGEHMTWEEIIISALKNGKNLEIAVKKATKVAPEEIASLLKDFPSIIQIITKRSDIYPKVISLLYFHFFATIRESFNEFPLKHPFTCSICIKIIKESTRMG